MLLAATLAWSCSRGRPELQHSFASPEALAAAILDGIARNDRTLLESLALSEEEFRDLVWPELPASRPERNMPWDYVWTDLRQKSRASLSAVLARHGGRRYRLEAIRYLGDSTKYATFEVRRDAELEVHDEEGALVSLRLFGSTLELRGRHKLFSFVVD